MTIAEIIELLNQKADANKIIFKEKKFGIRSTNALGIYHKDLKEMVKKIPKDDEMAIALFDSNIYEARLLCSKLYNPANLTEELMEKWTSTFENWEICDSFCMGLFAKSKYAIPKIIEWSDRKREFEKRAAFATLAAYCMADKKATNDLFESFLPLIKKASQDDRIYVKKAVNWALRSIGKRNKDLRLEAITCSEEIYKIDHKAARWIAQNALKELSKKDLRMSDYPREVYR